MHLVLHFMKAAIYKNVDLVKGWSSFKGHTSGLSGDVHPVWICGALLLGVPSGGHVRSYQQHHRDPQRRPEAVHWPAEALWSAGGEHRQVAGQGRTTFRENVRKASQGFSGAANPRRLHSRSLSLSLLLRLRWRPWVWLPSLSTVTWLVSVGSCSASSPGWALRWPSSPLSYWRCVWSMKSSRLPGFKWIAPTKLRFYTFPTRVNSGSGNILI